MCELHVQPSIPSVSVLTMPTEAGSKLETTAAVVAANQSAVDAAIAAAAAANSYAAAVQAGFNAGQLPPAPLMPA